MTPQMLVSKIRALGRMTQSEVAQAAGVSQAMISKLECGTVKDIMSQSYLALLVVYDSLQRIETERRSVVRRNVVRRLSLRK